MRRTVGFAASLFALVLLALTSSANAETLQAGVVMTPLNEVPPITMLNASGATALTIVVTRDASGNVTSGTINFTTYFTFPGSVTVTGLHIHEGSATVAAGVVFSSGIGGANTMTFASGSGLINLNATSVDVAILKRLLANPAGFYVNLHTTVNGGGAIRGQISKLVELAAKTVTMNTAEEVPAPQPVAATATATITAYPTRNSETGAATGGVVNFTVTFDFPGSVTFTGLHIHEGAVGVAAAVVIGTSVSGGNPVVSATGKGTINLNVPITTAAQIGALSRMLANPAGFYVNLHNTVNPGGVIRAQLSALSLPPYIGAISTYLGPTGNQAQMIAVTAINIDLASVVLINGQPVTTTLDLASGALIATIPAASLANSGVLIVQVRNAAGLLSQPNYVVVAASTNSVAATTVDAARFVNTVTPEGIAAAFGARLSTNTVSATSTPLPTTLDGTSVYVNGLLAALFFVSPGQINYQIPPNTLTGPARVVVVASDGTISTGVVNVANTAPAIFTRTANGLGAPAAVASADGQVFNINMSNADGTPVAIDAGNFVALFGTGLRFASGASAITIGGTAVTPLFVGAQGPLVGLDQANLQIPQSLAGRGDVDLIMTTDGQTSNTVKLRIR